MSEIDIIKDLPRKEQAVVCREIEEEARFTLEYLIMNILSAIIAAYGLFANSPAVVIGAMIVAMLIGPIIGISLSLVQSDGNLLKKGSWTLAGGILGVLVTAVFIGLIHRDIPLTNEILVRTSPNLIDLMIALAGGAAGAFATVSSRFSVAFIGVAVATAIVPPLSAAGILFARGEIKLGAGALLLASINMVAIQFASSFVLWVTGFRKVTQKSGYNLVTFLQHNLISLVILLILGFTLTINLRNVVSKQLFESKTRGTIRQEISLIEGNFLAEVRFEEQKDVLIVRAVVRGPSQIDAEKIAEIENKLPLFIKNKPIELRIRFVQTVIMNKYGYLYHDQSSSIQD